jgi:hypothetical protein
VNQPPLDYQVGVDLGNLARLVGYNLTENDSSLDLELVWLGLEETATSYRVFVHLLDDAGNILDQSDGEPSQWTRPTSGWMPGEYIVDQHQLGDIDGASELRIGLYDPDTGVRLRTGDGLEFVSVAVP